MIRDLKILLVKHTFGVQLLLIISKQHNGTRGAVIVRVCYAISGNHGL